MRNLNEVLRKDVTYDNIKSHKKPGLDPLSLSVSLSLCLSLSLCKIHFWKNYRGRVKLIPQPFKGKKNNKKNRITKQKQKSPQIMPPVPKHKRVHSNAKTENSSVDFDTLNFPEESVI